MTPPEVLHNADYGAVPVRKRTVPERLRWLADYLETDEGRNPVALLAVSCCLRLIADEPEFGEGVSREG